MASAPVVAPATVVPPVEDAHEARRTTEGATPRPAPEAAAPEAALAPAPPPAAVDTEAPPAPAPAAEAQDAPALPVPVAASTAPISEPAPASTPLVPEPDLTAPAPSAGDADSLVADNARIKATLPWQPRYDDLDTIVGHALAWERRLSEIGEGESPASVDLQRAAR